MQAPASSGNELLSDDGLIAVMIDDNKGYKWEGTTKKELYSRPMNFTALKKAAEILGTAVFFVESGEARQ